MPVCGIVWWCGDRTIARASAHGTHTHTHTNIYTCTHHKHLPNPPNKHPRTCRRTASGIPLRTRRFRFCEPNWPQPRSMASHLVALCRSVWALVWWMCVYVHVNKRAKRPCIYVYTHTHIYIHIYIPNKQNKITPPNHPIKQTPSDVSSSTPTPKQNIHIYTHILTCVKYIIHIKSTTINQPYTPLHT